MEYIGITAAQVNSILEQGGITTGATASAEGTRQAVAKVIEENNKKLLEDINKIIKDNGTPKFG